MARVNTASLLNPTKQWVGKSINRLTMNMNYFLKEADIFVPLLTNSTTAERSKLTYLSYRWKMSGGSKWLWVSLTCDLFLFVWKCQSCVWPVAAASWRGRCPQPELIVPQVLAETWTVNCCFDLTWKKLIDFCVTEEGGEKDACCSLDSLHRNILRRGRRGWRESSPHTRLHSCSITVIWLTWTGRHGRRGGGEEERGSLVWKITHLISEWGKNRQIWWVVPLGVQPGGLWRWRHEGDHAPRPSTQSPTSDDVNFKWKDARGEPQPADCLLIHDSETREPSSNF